MVITYVCVFVAALGSDDGEMPGGWSSLLGLAMYALHLHEI